jgi:hypothetical protein
MKKISNYLIVVLLLSSIHYGSVLAEDENIIIPDDNMPDIDQIIQVLKEKGFEVNRSMVETAMEYSFEDLVEKGDGIQGDIIIFERPIPAIEIAELDTGEDANLTTKTSYYISVLVTADEEYRSKFPNWKTKTYNLLENIDDYFIEKFGIDFVVTRFEQYYSDNSLSDARDLFSDVKSKVNKNDANIMIAFSAQYSGSIGGKAELCGDDVIIFYNPWHSWFSEDNVIQHELSHLFNAPDHNPGYFDWCVMSYFWCSFTHSWCDDCYHRIKQYIDENLIDLGGPLEVNTDKDLYLPSENVTITIHNTAESVLFLKKWSVEKWVKKSETTTGWDEIYWSFDFSNGHNDLPLLPIDNLSSIIPYNPFPSIIIPDGAVIIPTDSIVITNNLSGVKPEDWDYANPATILYPNQKLNWTWPQITSEKDEAGLGNYRIRIEYDSDYIVSVSFSINHYLEFKEPIILIESLFPGSIHVCDGFLIDFEKDGTFDAFQSPRNNIIVEVNQDANRNYLIDSDGDSKWDYVYNPTNGESMAYTSTNNDRVTPGFELILVLCAIAVSILLWKKKRNT